MASGDRRTVNPATEVVYLRLPKELVYVINRLQIAMRSQSKAETVRRLLETHPLLTEMAANLYNEGDTSPQPNR